MPVSPRITKLPAVPRVSAVGLEYTGLHNAVVGVAVGVFVGLGVGLGVGVVEAVAEGVPEGVPVGVLVAVLVINGVFVEVAMGAGPVVPGFQVPQPAAINITGPTDNIRVNNIFLFTNSSTFFVLENMNPLFFYRLMVGRTALLRHSNW